MDIKDADLWDLLEYNVPVLGISRQFIVVGKSADWTDGMRLTKPTSVFFGHNKAWPMQQGHDYFPCQHCTLVAKFSGFGNKPSPSLVAPPAPAQPAIDPNSCLCDIQKIMATGCKGGALCHSRVKP